MIARWVGKYLLNIEFNTKRIKDYDKLKLLEKALYHCFNKNSGRLSNGRRDFSTSTKFQWFTLFNQIRINGSLRFSNF